MNTILHRSHGNFQGSADDLIDTAQSIARKLKLTQEAGEGNERLLRHYVSVGVVDKPLREGRDAHYGFRHLLQYLAARRLLAEGFALAKIARFTSAVTTDDLVRYVQRSDPASEAELLVAAFKAESPASAGGRAALRARMPLDLGASPARRPLPTAPASLGMVDVMHELRHMEQRFEQRVQQLRDELNQFTQSIGQRGEARIAHTLVAEPEFDQVRQAIDKLGYMMAESSQRFGDLIEKPMEAIRQQLKQQEFLVSESQRTREFLDRIFTELGERQQSLLRQLSIESLRTLETGFADQRNRHDELLRKIEALSARIDSLSRT